MCGSDRFTLATITSFPLTARAYLCLSPIVCFLHMMEPKYFLLAT